MARVIDLVDVKKHYGEGALRTKVLFGIDLSFEEASFNAIIGGSGSGKSTLMNIIGTLDRPSSGEVMIAGEATATLSRDRLAELRNETTGFVFQFHFLLPEFTALDNVLMPYRIKHGRVDEEAVKRAEYLMDMMDLTKVKRNMANRMSGGQQQRTAIARALMNRPKIVLADEPTGNLDSESTEVVYDLLRNVHREQSTTFVIVTHDRHVAEKADRIVEIRDGRVAMDMTK